MYSRATNYKKFGFSHFYTLTGPDVISHQDKIDDSPYVSDEATYESTIEEVKKTDGNQFLQVITMQNHMHTTIGIRTTISRPNPLRTLLWRTMRRSPSKPIRRVRL